MATTRKSLRRTDGAYGQIDRLVNFSDAVMAIAATLLILPMAEDISSLHAVTLQSLRNGSGHEFLIFVLSFVVICRFWLIHHDLFSPLQKFGPAVFWLNALWLLTIVVLPFSTELLGKSANYSALTVGVYIGTMVVTTYAGFFLRRHIINSPKLQKPSLDKELDLAPYTAACIVMTAAILVAILIPAIGPWALLLLFSSGRLAKSLKQ